MNEYVVIHRFKEGTDKQITRAYVIKATSKLDAVQIAHRRNGRGGRALAVADLRIPIDNDSGDIKYGMLQAVKLEDTPSYTLGSKF